MRSGQGGTAIWPFQPGTKPPDRNDAETHHTQVFDNKSSLASSLLNIGNQIHDLACSLRVNLV